MKNHVLKLYVTGDTQASQKAIQNIRDICEEKMSDYQLEVIDIRDHPQLAENEKIWATPTLIKEVPKPLQRMIGNFSKTEDVLLGLGIADID